MRCASYCTAESFDIDELVKYFRDNGYEPKFYDKVIHISKEDIQSKERSDLFCFPYGCVVFWNFDEDSESNMLAEIKPFEVNSLSRPADDSMRFYYEEEGETRIDQEEDTIILESDDPHIKLSISYAMSQTVILDVFEQSVQKLIAETRYLSDELSKAGTVSIPKNKLTRHIGALFAERNLINLNSEILDTPEFFWRRPRYEPYYLMAFDSLDIDQRHHLLNKRLDVVHDLYAKLSDELNHRHSSKLEWIIIYLISFEVLVVILKDILHLI